MGATTLLAQIKILLIRILNLFSDSLKSVANDIEKVEKKINYYGICGTAAATAAKAVTVTTAVTTKFKLETGTRVAVKFTNANTANNPTLNVNATGAKEISYRGYAIPAAALQANSTLDMVYNGTQWEVVGFLGWAE